MPKITAKNYHQDTTHLTYHMILDFQKCEFLFSEKLKGKVPVIKKDYFTYGKAFDSLLTGSFEEEFVIGRKIDPAIALDRLAQAKLKAQEAIGKLIETGTDKALLKIREHEEKLFEIEKSVQEIEQNADKEVITDTIFRHIEKSAEEFGRQDLIASFTRDPKKNQAILTTKVAGIKVKGKLDWFDEKKGIVDYKTTASMLRFDPSNYIGQMSWYQMLAEKVTGKVLPCYLFVVDKDADNKHSRFWQYTQETLDTKREELLKWVETIKEAQKLGMYEPAALRDINICYTCPHFNTCPFTVQKEFQTL